MSDKKMKVEICQACFIAGEVAAVGDVVELEADTAMHIIGNGRAKAAKPDAKVGKAKAEAEK